jgi:hypothetical protein
MFKFAPVALSAVIGVGALLSGAAVQARPIVVGLPVVIYPPALCCAYPGLGYWRAHPYRYVYWHGRARYWH